MIEEQAKIYKENLCSICSNANKNLCNIVTVQSDGILYTQCDNFINKDFDFKKCKRRKCLICKMRDECTKKSLQNKI